jgi:hypothetical protein
MAAPASKAKPLVALPGSISGATGVAEAIPANPTTSMAALLPSKSNRDVVVVVIFPSE